MTSTLIDLGNAFIQEDMYFSISELDITLSMFGLHPKQQLLHWAVHLKVRTNVMVVGGI